MEITKKHIITIVVLVVAAALLVSAYLFNSKTPSTPQMPAVTQGTPQTTNMPPKATETTSTAQAIPPLPADNKQAIDTEIDSINKTLDETEASISADMADEELGL